MIQEKRTVQFVVERGHKAKLSARAAASLPWACWVYWPPEKRMDYRLQVYCKATRVFRITPESLADHSARFGMPVLGTECVCECMGHLIE